MMKQRRVFRVRHPLGLTPAQAVLLDALRLAPAGLSREALSVFLYGDDEPAQPETITVLICKLRRGLAHYSIELPKCPPAKAARYSLRIADREKLDALLGPVTKQPTSPEFAR